MPIVKVEVPKKVTKGQTYHEEVEDLKKQGVSNADAIREVAKTHRANENAVRGGIHQYKRSRGITSTSTSQRGSRTAHAAKTFDDFIAQARQALLNAREHVHSEVRDAETELQAAQKRFDEVKASVDDRLADIEKKLKALQ